MKNTEKQIVIYQTEDKSRMESSASSQLNNSHPRDADYSIPHHPQDADDSMSKHPQGACRPN